MRGINAAAWLVRTSTFNQTGGFDPIFFMYGEDDDLIARFEEHKVRFGLVTHSRVVHLRETASPIEKPDAWQVMRATAAKTRSGLIVLIKRPGYSVAHMTLQLFVHGMIKPFANFILERNSIDFFSTVLAAFQVLAELPRVRRHARLCATSGDHFLGSRAARDGDGPDHR